jgi:hypothetical protein
MQAPANQFLETDSHSLPLHGRNIINSGMLRSNLVHDLLFCAMKLSIVVWIGGRTLWWTSLIAKKC